MDWYEIGERDHEIQNPTTPEKIRQLGRYLRLTGQSRVLDVACGKGGPALVLAEAFGCRISGIEVRQAFAEEARRRAKAAGLDSLVDVQVADASTTPLEAEAWDAALCIGAAFVWGTIAEAAEALAPAVRRGGYVAIGEPFWRAWPLRDIPPRRSEFVGLDETLARFERSGLATTGIIAASEDDWDVYRSLHWRAIEEWLSEHASHPGADEIRARLEDERDGYVRTERALLGWAIFVGRKP